MLSDRSLFVMFFFVDLPRFFGEAAEFVLEDAPMAPSTPARALADSSNDKQEAASFVPSVVRSRFPSLVFASMIG